MRNFKQRLAIVLAALFMIPAQPAIAEPMPPQWSQEAYEGAGQVEEPAVATSSDALPQASEDDDIVKATSSDALPKNPEEEVKFNTGSCEYSVVGYEDFLENKLGDAYFAEDGSFTINIPESNPFFPYEVQFTHDGSVTNEWFMTPDDSVEVGGHTFYVSAYFDNTVMTQMSLEIAGNKVVAYPEKKEFTDGDGTEAFSLLPLERRRLRVDVHGYTPVELTMVAIDSIFVGEEALKDTDQVMWSYVGRDYYTTSSAGEMIDLSYRTCYGNTEWEMITGENDQLADTNIRYFVTLELQKSEDWLIPTVCSVDDEGKRTNVQVWDSSYYDSGSRYLDIDVLSKDVNNGAYVSFKVNPNVFDSPRYAQIKVYEGNHQSAEEAAESTEITDRIYDVDIMAEDAGYMVKTYDELWITLVTFDVQGNVTGCLPFSIDIVRKRSEPYVSTSLWVLEGDSRELVSHRTKTNYSNGCENIKKVLDYGYLADGKYTLSMEYFRDAVDHSEEVTAAYVGHYTSISKASEAGAKNIKTELFVSGYETDYSKGVDFTIFEGTDGEDGQVIYHCNIKAEENTTPLNRSTWVTFNGLNGKDENYVNCYVVNTSDDSYAENNYLTILVDEDVDLTSLAPRFNTGTGVNLYTSGSSSPEISGESFHDFSNGPVEYTASAEDGINSKNYWLQVVKAEGDEGWLYINSLADEDAETREEDGVIYSTREVFLDGLHDYVHDIFIANMGKNEITSLSAELISEEVELDDYWTLKGEHGLSGFSLDYGTSYDDEMSNLAKIRIKAKEDVEDGKDVSGTLTIKSGDTALIVLTLTGTVGDPSIITKEIPPAVKYVPYGTMIQNSNKYSWNRVSYNLYRGKLPAGMELRPNGELYGVPTEVGAYTFTVRMENSEDSFSDSFKTFTLIVNENTDVNVDAATDQGYDLTQRVQDIDLNSTADQMLVSQGIYDEFTNLFLDGVKLQKDVDYTSESGSTKITIKSQTLKGSNKTGTRTLGIEFRSKDTKELKRAAQNYTVKGKNHSTGNSGSSGSSGGSGKKATIANDTKKGFTDAVKGIITGNSAGYSQWKQDEYGWKLIYADGTTAAGSMVAQTDGTALEQVLWERINGSMYAFGKEGYLKSGWLYDYQLNGWYCMSVESGMMTGWYKEPQDNCIYYLDAVTGRLTIGWRNIEEKWYYFNEVSDKPTWLFDEETGKWSYDIRSKHKPLGSLYKNGKTPDGYFVNADGVWDGKEK